MSTRIHRTPARFAILSLALLAAALPATAGKIKCRGYAEFRDGEFLVVDGQRVRSGPKTRVSAPGADTLAAIPLGYEVRVKGKRQEDGSVLAKKVFAFPNEETSTEVQMKHAFDEIEAYYREQGHMRRHGSDGEVVEDYGELQTEGPQVDRVRGITETLLPDYVDPEAVRVYVVDNPEWNAMAAPNYSIYVFSGLLDDMDDDEVALVLGHEIAHATHEHSRRQAGRGSWAQIGLLAAQLVAVETIDDELAETAAVIGANLAASAVVNGYSRDHEDQADRVGMRYAWQAGYDISKGPGLWSKFGEKYGESDVLQNFFFGSHSRSTKRSEDLAEEIAYNYPDGVKRRD